MILRSCQIQPHKLKNYWIKWNMLLCWLNCIWMQWKANSWHSISHMMCKLKPKMEATCKKLKISNILGHRCKAQWPTLEQERLCHGKLETIWTTSIDRILQRTSRSNFSDYSGDRHSLWVRNMTCYQQKKANSLDAATLVCWENHHLMSAGES